MAGTGKTTVAETLCRLLDEKNLLGASFFCSNKGCRDVRSIFPSLAKTLAYRHAAFRAALVVALSRHPDPLGLDLKDQFQELILKPAKAGLSGNDPIIIAIDALDECDDQKATEMLLCIILESKLGVPLRFFATS